MIVPNVVLDTNVIMAGLRSRRGASFRLLEIVGTGRFKTHVAVPLALEYEAVLSRQAPQIGLDENDIEAVLDYLASVSEPHSIWYLWRPVLRDPADEMVLEIAVTGECDYIITFNERDFSPAVAQFGLETLTPGAFLQRLGGRQ